MTKGSAAQEPTMEEILASIRRIISDEETPEAEASAAAADEPPAEMSEEDLDKLFDEMQLCFADVLASTEEFPEIEIDPELIPEIHLEVSES